MSNQVDQEFTRVMEAMSESAQPAPPLVPTRIGERRTVRPVVAVVSAFVAVILTLGLGAFFVASIRSSDAVEQTVAGTDYSTGSIEAYWNWVTTGAVQLEPTDTSLEGDAVGVTQFGPEPKFDPTELGEVQRILSYAEIPYTTDTDFGEVFPIIESEFIPPVAFIGTLEGTSGSAVLYRILHTPTGETRLCLDDYVNGERGISCVSYVDPAADGFIWTVEHDEPFIAQSTIRVGMAMLPSQTSVVVLTSADGRTFVQRPIGGLSIIEFAAGDAPFPFSVEALDENGDVLARDAFDGATRPEETVDD